MMDYKIKKEFVNPYNFVPLGQVKKQLDRDSVYGSRDCEDNDKKLLSGYLDVSMYVKTPLIIPDAAHKTLINASDRNNVKHAKYDFFNVTDEKGNKKYIIPGSTLRGSIRSMYEAATNSCFPFLMDDKPSSYRLPLYMHMNKRGLLYYNKENNEWQLYEAEVTKEKLSEIGGLVTEKNEKEKKLENKFRDKSGKEIKPGWYDIQKKGITQCNVPVNLEGYHINYLKKNPQKLIKTWKNDDTPYKELKSALSQDGVSGKKGTGGNAYYVEYLKRQLENVKNGKKTKSGIPYCVPVYYIEVEDDNKENIVYMSNAAIGRIGQHRKWKDIVGDFKPCNDTSNLCPACLLFGTINGNGKNKQKGLKSHIRFTDAISTKEIKPEEYTLQILAEPKPSAYEFYLKKPEDSNYWNFDFSGEAYTEIETYKNKNNEVVEKEVQKISYKYYSPQIRGRKMYWHSNNYKDNPGKPGRMNSTMRAVEKGKFKFRVYFDEITRTQLGDLVWTITLGENCEESSRQYKIGHAKPLGFGSVKFVVDTPIIRSVDENLNVKREPLDGGIEALKTGEIDLKSESLMSLIKIVDAKTTNTVSYPIGLDKKNKKMIYEWFSLNRTSASSVDVLPYVTEDNIAMKSKWHESDM
jgi:CRISPR-associated protein (TIGR03986 family)